LVVMTAVAMMSSMLLMAGTTFMIVLVPAVT
jgi:hypothetical protein